MGLYKSQRPRGSSVDVPATAMAKGSKETRRAAARGVVGFKSSILRQQRAKPVSSLGAGAGRLRRAARGGAALGSVGGCSGTLEERSLSREAEGWEGKRGLGRLAGDRWTGQMRGRRRGGLKGSLGWLWLAEESRSLNVERQ